MFLYHITLISPFKAYFSWYINTYSQFPTLTQIYIPKKVLNVYEIVFHRENCISDLVAVCILNLNTYHSVILIFYKTKHLTNNL